MSPRARFLRFLRPQRCVHTQKVVMSQSEAEALAHRTDMSAYQCPFGPHWHVGHRKEDQSRP